VPAAVVAARALFADGEVRKGSKILEAAWKCSPHPDIASTYVYGRAGDTVQDRLKRAKHLVTLRSNNAEGSLAVARAAYEAGDYRLARDNAEQVLRGSPRESAYLLLADIEEAETGDQGKVRQWLAQAVKAPRDPAWTADGYVSEQWSPVSPVTGRLNSFEWKVPVEQLSPVIEVEKPEVAEAVPDRIPENKAIVPVEKHELKPKFHDVVEAEVVVPEAEPVKVKPEPVKPEIKQVEKPAVLDVAEPDVEGDNEKRPGHMIVDDPGVDERKASQKSQNSGLRLF
jgi:HemY protein